MAVWPGWEDDLLGAAGLPTNAANRRFLDEWHSHANSNCPDNPVDISRREPGSTRCAALPSGREAQAYTSHASAANGFADELNLTDYPNLREALASGNPYGPAHRNGVGLDLQKWGSIRWQAAYLKETAPPPPGIHAPHALHGWHDVQHSVNVRLPATLRQSNRHTVRALQALARARKVRL